MNELIEDYQRKINSVNELLKNQVNDEETINRLKIKVGCYRSFLTDLNRALNIDLVSDSLWMVVVKMGRVYHEIDTYNDKDKAIERTQKLSRSEPSESFELIMINVNTSLYACTNL